MFRRGLMTLGYCTLFVLAPTAVTAKSPAATARVETWIVDSLVKVFPSDIPPRGARTAPEFWTARNQHVSIQLAIRSPRAHATVTAQVEPLKGPEGSALQDATIRRVGYVVVGSHSKDTPENELIGEAPGWFPDPLLDPVFDLKPGKTQCLWVTVPVPADARPGIYRGSIDVRYEGTVLARTAFRVRVVAAMVPTDRSLKITNWFNVNDKASQQFYGVKMFSPGWWTLLENLARVMASHRQNVVITPLDELVTPRVEDGKLRYDFANFDRWVETFKRAGVIGYIEGGHLIGRRGSYDAPLEIDALVPDSDQVAKVALAADDPRATAFLESFLPALNAHLEEKGWKSIYYQHILDEAHGKEPPYYARVAELVHRYLPGVPTLDAVDASEMPEELQKNCDTWVPQLGRFDGQMELLAQRIAGGREVWFYTCLFPNKQYMNRLMDYSLLKVRLLHWLNFRYSFTGYLHWGWNYWTPEPINDTQPVIDANTELLPSGDAFIVYPDKGRQSVYSSIRLETMRDGIEDYELLRQLKATKPSEADRLARAAIASLTDYVRDPAAFRKLQRELLTELSK